MADGKFKKALERMRSVESRLQPKGRSLAEQQYLAGLPTHLRGGMGLQLSEPGRAISRREAIRTFPKDETRGRMSSIAADVLGIKDIKRAITNPSPTSLGMAALSVGAILPAGRVGKFALWASKAGKAAKAAEEVNIWARPTRAAANRAARLLVKKRAAESATRRVGWLLPK